MAFPAILRVFQSARTTGARQFDSEGGTDPGSDSGPSPLPRGAKNGKEVLVQFLEHLTHASLEDGEVVSQRYKVVRFIASGGMADVYESLDLETSASVALKVLHFDLSASPDHVAQFRRELIASRAIVHPAVNPTYDIIHGWRASGESIWYLTMRYAPGLTLEERIREGPSFSAGTLYRWLTTLAGGLSAIHAAGVIHGDLSARNVQLTGQPEGQAREAVPVIMDFGLARLQAEATGDADWLDGAGSPGYMSPEQKAREPLSASADVFSFGRVAERCGAAVHGRWKHMPFWLLLDGVVRKCVQAEPAKRYGDGAQLLRALRRARLASHAIQGAFIVLTIALLFPLFLRLPAVQLRLAPQPPESALYFYENGSSHLLAGANYAAVKSLRHALDLYPKWPLAIASYAEALDSVDAHREAVAQISKALDPGMRMGEADRRYVEAVRGFFAQNWSEAAAGLKPLMRNSVGSMALRSRSLLGRIYEKSGSVDQALALYRENVPSMAAGGQMLRLAAILADRMRLPEARQACGRAQNLFEAAGNSEALVESYYEQGYLENHYGDASLASALLQKALTLAQAIGENQEIARIYVEMSMLNIWGGDLVRARQYDDLAREMIVRFGLDTVAPQELKARGDICFHNSDTGCARSDYLAGLNLARELGAPQPQAVLLTSLADVSLFASRIAEGDRYAAEALRIARSNHLPRLTSVALMFEGRAKRKEGDYTGAMAAFEEEKRIADDAGDAAGKAQASESISSVLAEREFYPEAIEEIREALALAEKDGEGILAAYVAARWALVAGELGDIATSHRMLDAARARSGGSAALSVRCDFLEGRLAGFEGDPRKAARLLLRSEQATAPEDQETRAEAASYRATQEFLLQRTGAALALARTSFEAARKLGVQPVENETRLNLAWLSLQTRKPEEAISALSSAHPAFFDLPETGWKAHRILAEANRMRGDNAAAAREDSAAARSLAGLKATWQTSYYNSWRDRADIRAWFPPAVRTR